MAQDIEAMGRELAAKLATPGLQAHPISHDYKVSHYMLYFGVGLEAGRRGLDDKEVHELLQAVLPALPTSDA